MIRKFYRSFNLVPLILIMPLPAEAYIDPGIMSSAIQGIFALLAVGGALFIFGPWEWVKSKILKTDKKEPSDHDDEAKIDGSA